MRNVRVCSIVVVAVLVVPSARAADLPSAPAPRPAGFTAETAKRALLGLMETRDQPPVWRADVKKFADIVAEVAPGNYGTARWGPFTLDLTGPRYLFRVGSGKGPKPWFMAYEGQFELRGDK
jgi:hypothetical protein